MRLSCYVSTLGRCTSGMIYGSPGNDFYGNDINDLHLFICPFPFPFVPGTLDHWGGLRSNRAHTRYPATCTFTSSSSSSSSSIPLFSTLGRLQDQTRITTIPHITCTRPTDKCPLLRGTTGTGRTYSVTYHHRLLGCHDVRNTPLFMSHQVSKQNRYLTL